MKRALAERAKQSGLPNGVGPSAPASEPNNTVRISCPPHSSSSQPDLSGSSPQQDSAETYQKSALSITKSNSGPPSSSVASPRPSPRPKKRLRESVVKLEEEDEEDANASAFYLRHQNRALASELRKLKYQLGRLERERDVRRSQCGMAVQSLNTLEVTWTQLEAALQNGHPPPADGSNAVPDPASYGSAPLSTGSGRSVELIGALLTSLRELGKNSPKRRRIKSGDPMDVDADSDEDSSKSDDDGTEKSSLELLPPSDSAEDDDPDHSASAAHLDDLLRISDSVSNRASILHGWIWSLLKRCEAANGGNDSAIAEQVHAAQQQVARLKGKNKSLKAQMKEIARSRDEMQESDKRVRRGLYRLAAGRVQLKEVLKAVAASDEDKEAAALWIGESGSTNLSEPATTAAESENGDGNDGPSISSAEVAQLQKRINDLEQIANSRDDQIKALLAEKEEQSKKISTLILESNGKSASAPSGDEIKKSDFYAELNAKLLAAERNVKELEEKQSRMREEWGQALATADGAQKAIEDLNQKHVKRWSDLMEEFPELAATAHDEGGEIKMEEKSTEDNDRNSKAKENIILQHKLTQALENVRQAQATRKTLQEAVMMNESLQSKLEEIKAKYSTLQLSRSNTAAPANGTAADGGLATPKAKAPSYSDKPEKIDRPDKPDKSSDKLHREYRRVQKQLAAATASKESAKAKLEKAEKERDMLNSSNARLLKQAAEKDDMNAKSLSTILHLKQLTDQITKEKENLEQQVKSSQQLALSARLAANARERLSEEMSKERESMEARVKEWEDKCNSLANEKEQIEAKMLQNRSRMAELLKEVEGAKGRCEELASESTHLQQEKQQIMESLAIAKKDAEEASKMTERLSKASGGAIVEGFTAEQLHTQVKHLKSRVHCPVCNVRDKKCILLRCRHMFCKNCVDENIKNRSRKCPACGIRFDTKDVGDIWL